MGRGEGSTTRAIARYYYLHSLTHDLTFAHAVDEIVFHDWPAGQRTYEQVRGYPVFPREVPNGPSDDALWKSAEREWRMDCKSNRPANGLLASLSVESTQSGDTRNPIALVAEVHMRSAYEHESGIELRFRSVHIELICESHSLAEMTYTIGEKSSLPSGSHTFYLDGSGSYPYVTVSDDSEGLDGNYVSDTLVVFNPNCQSSDFNAALRARITQTNVTFPTDMELSSKMKREIIRRMVEKAILPQPDAAGLIPLHELQYNVSAVERRGK